MWAFPNPFSMFEEPKIFQYGPCSGIWAHACAIIEWGKLMFILTKSNHLLMSLFLPIMREASALWNNM